MAAQHVAREVVGARGAVDLGEVECRLAAQVRRLARLGAGAEAGEAADLRREAAFNLAQIYRASGADDLARDVLRRHFTV